MGRCLIDPNNPAFRQFPGFNRTFEEYMSHSKKMMEGWTRGDTQDLTWTPPEQKKTNQRLFIMSDDAEWVTEGLEGMRMGNLSGEFIPPAEQAPFAAKLAAMPGHGLMLPDNEGNEDFAATYHGKRNSKSHETLLFFASLKIGGSCRSLVYNGDSSIASTLRRTACAHDFKECLDARGAIADLSKHRDQSEVSDALDDWRKNDRRCRRLLGHMAPDFDRWYSR
jgi:hypothetical protein